MGACSEWAARASDDGALLIYINQAVIPKHSLCSAPQHEQEHELGEASRTPARARSSPRRLSELVLLLVPWCSVQAVLRNYRLVCAVQQRTVVAGAPAPSENAARQAPIGIIPAIA